MKFIKPNEISSKIMTLIDESDQFILLVSPYVKISKWYKLIKKLESINQRNIPIHFVIRDDETNKNSFEELNKLGISFTAIKDLHCKLYINESQAIVSSMNLLLSSEINSIELAYLSETKEEYNQLKDFCSRYLRIDLNDFKKSTFQAPEINIFWEDNVCDSLSNQFKRGVNASYRENTFEVYTGKNTFTSFIWNSKNKNRLRICGILSQKEFDFLNQNQTPINFSKDFTTELVPSNGNHYNTIWATSEFYVNSRNLPEIGDIDSKNVENAITDFISKIELFKLEFNEKVYK